MISKEAIKKIDLEEIRLFCKKVGPISSPIARELVLPNLNDREVLIEKFIDDKKNILGISLLVKEGKCEKAILASKEPSIKMIELSDFDPDFWMLPDVLNLEDSEWNVIMEGNYYIGNIDKRIEAINLDDLNFKWTVLKNGISESSYWNNDWEQILIPDSESPVSEPDVFRKWIFQECFVTICFLEGEPIGIASACISPTPVVNFLFCIDKFRGRGIGRALLLKLKNEIYLNKHLSLYAMSPKDKEKLYFKSGFKNDQSWRLWMK